MSALTEDLDLPSVDLPAGRLYDPAFKLFGRTIPVSSDIPAAAIDGRYQAPRTMVTGSGDASSVQDAEDENPESDDESFMPDELGSSSGSNDGGDQLKLVEHIKDKREGSALISDDLTQNGGNHLCAPNADERNKGDEPTELHAPKRPEKPIPCPRCHSLDTKFCYFNNYNVNQPRHFCKNCQRYWTAGGTLRNVPVGAGRRKNKNSSTHFRSALPDLVVARGDWPENAQQVISGSTSAQMSMNGQFKAGLSAASAPLQEIPLDLQRINTFEDQPSSAVLSFGQESSLCVSTRGSSFTPCRSEVLQDYKPEMTRPQVKYPFILPSIGGPQCDRSFSEAIPRKEAALNTAAIPVNGDAKVQKLLVRTSATERSSEPEGSVSCNPETQPAGLDDFRKCVDAALAWATNGPFPFMGLPWQYGTGLGWANTSPPAGHGSAGLGLIPSTSAGLGNMWQGASGSCSTGSASSHGGGFGGPAPWAPALGPWAAAIPWPIMQNSMWVPPGWGGPWTMPWTAPLSAAATAAAAAAAAAVAIPDLGATTLGKHAREPEDASDGERCRPVLVPKTLRIDDPGEAARSSIWSTLGIDLCADRLTGGGMFRGLQCKTYIKNNDPHANTRHSNPAAIGRLLNFQESNLSVPTLDLDDKTRT